MADMLENEEIDTSTTSYDLIKEMIQSERKLFLHFVVNNRRDVITMYAKVLIGHVPACSYPVHCLCHATAIYIMFKLLVSLFTRMWSSICCTLAL